MGCLALKKVMLDGMESYRCELAYQLNYVQVKHMAISPSPLEKCVKPKTEDQYNEARAKQDKAVA